MATNKNNLSSKTPIHSSLSDIAEDTRLDPGFEVEFEDAQEPEKAPKWPVSIGWHKVVAVSIDKVENTQTYVDQFGVEHSIDPHWEIGLEDIKTHEMDVLSFPITPKAERSFKLAINTRSHKDLGKKIAPREVTELTVVAVARYLAKFPVEFCYDHSSWVDEAGETQRSKKPKWLLWVPEDFQMKSHTKNWISLR